MHGFYTVNQEVYLQLHWRRETYTLIVPYPAPSKHMLLCVIGFTFLILKMQIFSRLLISPAHCCGSNMIGPKLMLESDGYYHCIGRGVLAGGPGIREVELSWMDRQRTALGLDYLLGEQAVLKPAWLPLLFLSSVLCTLPSPCFFCMCPSLSCLLSLHVLTCPIAQVSR